MRTLSPMMAQRMRRSIARRRVEHGMVDIGVGANPLQQRSNDDTDRLEIDLLRRLARRRASRRTGREKFGHGITQPAFLRVHGRAVYPHVLVLMVKDDLALAASRRIALVDEYT